eukprot:753126-Alexandrium_andersonii.AAC.1
MRARTSSVHTQRGSPAQPPLPPHPRACPRHHTAPPWLPALCLRPKTPRSCQARQPRRRAWPPPARRLA